jgi:uncharacterized membrane protein YvlD (DUF360 family)
MHSFIHSFTHSLIHSFIHSLIHSFTHSLIHLFTHSLIHSFTHSLIHSFIHSFTHSLIHSLIHSFTHSFIHSFTHSFIHSFIRSFVHSFILTRTLWNLRRVIMGQWCSDEESSWIVPSMSQQPMDSASSMMLFESSLTFRRSDWRVSDISSHKLRFTDKSLDEALCRIVKIGHLTWHVKVCRLLCERVRLSPWLLSIYALDETDNYPNGPLHVALRFGRVSIARLMVEDYSSIFSANQLRIHLSPYPHGTTPLHYAVCICNVANAHANRHKMRRVLLNHGAKPNNDQMTVHDISVLFLAVQERNRVLVRLLMQYGADPFLLPEMLPK